MTVIEYLDDHLGTAILDYIRLEQDDKVVAILKEKPTSILYEHPPNYDTNLFLTFCAYSPEVACYCMEKMAVDVNKADKSGATALMKAVFGGFMCTVQALLDAGANVNAQDNDGKTALHYAKPSQVAETYSAMQLLIQRKDFNLETKNNNNETPLISIALNFRSKRAMAKFVRFLNVLEVACTERQQLISRQLVECLEVYGSLLNLKNRCYMPSAVDEYELPFWRQASKLREKLRENGEIDVLERTELETKLRLKEFEREFEVQILHHDYFAASVQAFLKFLRILGAGHELVRAQAKKFSEFIVHGTIDHARACVVAYYRDDGAYLRALKAEIDILASILTENTGPVSTLLKAISEYFCFLFRDTNNNAPQSDIAFFRSEMVDLLNILAKVFNVDKCNKNFALCNHYQIVIHALALITSVSLSDASENDELKTALSTYLNATKVERTSFLHVYMGLVAEKYDFSPRMELEFEEQFNIVATTNINPKTEILKMILSAGADPNYPNVQCYDTPLALFLRKVLQLDVAENLRVLRPNTADDITTLKIIQLFIRFGADLTRFEEHDASAYALCEYMTRIGRLPREFLDGYEESRRNNNVHSRPALETMDTLPAKSAKLTTE